MENGKKELNLTDVLLLCGKGIKKLFLFCIEAIGWCLRIIYQKRNFLLCFIVAGLVFGFILSIDNRDYKTGFTLSTNVKNPYFCSRIIDNLDSYCGDTVLAEMLEIDTLTALQVKSIKPYFVVDINSDSIIDFIDYDERYKIDTAINVWSKKFLYVEIIADNDSCFEIVKDGVVRYVNNDKSLLDELSLYIKNEERWIEMLNQELDQVVAVQERLFSSDIKPRIGMEEFNHTTSMFGETRVQMFWGGKIYLMQKICPHIILLERYKKGAVMVELPMERATQERHYASNMVQYGLLGFILGFVLIIFLKYRKVITSYLEKK